MLSGQSGFPMLGQIQVNGKANLSSELMTTSLPCVLVGKPEGASLDSFGSYFRISNSFHHNYALGWGIFLYTTTVQGHILS